MRNPWIESFQDLPSDHDEEASFLSIRGPRVGGRAAGLVIAKVRRSCTHSRRCAGMAGIAAMSLKPLNLKATREPVSPRTAGGWCKSRCLDTASYEAQPDQVLALGL